MKTQLPPGSRMPAALQTLGMWSRPIPSIERARARFGRRFTLRLLGTPPFVVLSDPEEIKQVLTAPADVLHPGEGARILEPLLGRNSVILLDEAQHLEQRRLMLPAFHGERMQALATLMKELSEREVDSWPRDEAIELHPRLQRLTLEIVLRAVFGLHRGSRLDDLRELLTGLLAFTESPLSLLPPPPPWLERVLGAGGPLGRLIDLRGKADLLVYDLIEERRRESSKGADVLSLLLEARHEDGSPMSAEELRDELMTALVAGHETTASQLAWAFMHLAREPRVRERLRCEVDADAQDAYLTATINETMRRSPVLPNAEPRLVKRPVKIGAIQYEPGVVLVVNAYLVHHDPAIYPDPYAFLPERFLEREGGGPPGTYTWLAFGGGRRRCLGASFAQLEMKAVLRAVLGRFDLEALDQRHEHARRRSITLSPSSGATVILREREGRSEAFRPAVPLSALAGR